MTDKDRDIIRGLASEIARIAEQPVQQERIEGWKRINSLQSHRPMLWITEIPWGEFENEVDELKLRCEDTALHPLEGGFRKMLFTTRHLPCDHVFSDTFYLPKVISGMGYGVQTDEVIINQGNSSIVAHAYKSVIKDFEDIEKICIPHPAYDQEATEKNVAFHEGLFGDILKVETLGPQQHWFSAWDRLVCWTGVTEALMDLTLRPDFIHAIMRRMTDSKLAEMTQLEEQGLLGFPHPMHRVGSGAASYTDELPQPDADPNHIRTMDQWGGATPQIFSDVSPEMHEEFALNYENEIMERCGLNYYGCCEPLHNKMELMAKVPRLRKISISPWCDVEKAHDRAQKRYVFSHKPSPAILAEETFPSRRAEDDLRLRLAQSGEMPCEVIMKDISTVRGDMKRLISWCEMAWEVVNSVS